MSIYYSSNPIIISISEAFGGIPLGAEPPGTGRLRSTRFSRIFPGNYLLVVTVIAR